VSGGADSLAMVALALEAGHCVEAWHVDHALRDSSAVEAEWVASLLAPLGVPVRVVRVEIGRGPNLEERARTARYGVLPDGILVAHTADDVAETVIVNLLRGAGVDGLAVMQRGVGPAGRRIIRPLLALRRRETEEVCRRLGWEPLRDPMNGDPRFVRARIRAEVVPLLDDVAGRDVVPLLARLATVAADDRGILDALSEGIDPTDCAALRAVDPALARRVVRRWITALDGRPPSHADLDRVMAVVRGDARACEITGGVRVSRSAGRLRIG
jgi:tRNA(Ile)-lysidine synthase